MIDNNMTVRLFDEDVIPRSSGRYVVITPVRDEAKHMDQAIQAMLAQTVPPLEWVIVDDGSKDGTGQIIDRYAGKIPWIRAVHKADRGYRKAGSGVIEAFYEGYKALSRADWDFIVKLDGDLTFATDYFQKILERFYEDPHLGIAGGMIFNAVNGTARPEEGGPQFHVRGATKVYRRRCWEAINGLYVLPGWDTLDEVKANMNGWKTQTFRNLQLIQHRPTGAAEGWWNDRVKNGRAYYVSGYHPIFFAAKFFYRMLRPPYVVGAIAMCYGFVDSYVRKAPRVDDPDVIRYLRREQMKRLLRRESIWK